MTGDGIQLTAREGAFRDRMVRSRNLFLAFSIAGVMVGVGIAVHAAIAGSLPAPRLVILTLVLLLARSHLRQYRSATVLWKISPRPIRRDPP